MDGTLLCWPQPAVIIIMWAVGGGEASLSLPGGTAATDVVVQSPVCRYGIMVIRLLSLKVSGQGSWSELQGSEVSGCL